MEKYVLLYANLCMLLLTWSFAYQPNGGLRLSGNKKLIVKDNSIFRKVLLRKKNRDYPLEIYKVIPWAVTFVLFCVVLLIYIFYIALYSFPVGMAIGNFLEGTIVKIFCIIWFLLIALYIGVINAI